MLSRLSKTSGSQQGECYVREHQARCEARFSSGCRKSGRRHRDAAYDGGDGDQYNDSRLWLIVGGFSSVAVTQPATARRETAITPT